MLGVIIIALMKIFFYMRIIEKFSPIVTMLQNVISDLKIFLLFYFILILLFSLLMGVLGVGNPNVPGSGITKDDIGEPGFPGEEYRFTGLFLGNFISTLRMSMGDFDFDASLYLEQE